MFFDTFFYKISKTKIIQPIQKCIKICVAVGIINTINEKNGKHIIKFLNKNVIVIKNIMF